jgi:hypothetical protein
MSMGTLEELTEKRAGIKLRLGESVTGTITGTSSQQSNDFDTQQPAFFDSGAPMMLAVPGDRMRIAYKRDETQADRDERGVKRTPPIPAKLYQYDFSAGVAVATEPTDVPF